MVTKRNSGADIPSDMQFALERDGVVVGYARNEEEANRYIANAGNDASSRAFFEKKHGPKLFGATADEVVGRAVGNGIVSESASESRQHMRRIERFREVFDQFLIDRARASHGPNLLRVTWEEFSTMHREYQDAAKAGEGKDFPFQPLSTYATKLVREGKRPIRPLLEGEVGVWTNRNGEAKIILLQDRGPGDVGEKYFAVPGNYPGGK